ncbi:hypothetical protein [Sphingomonas sp. Leaf205]|uniref:hypothetical protein n=1 Tax=Sphingomonas sp. Leaf205 TaxID=2876551 RepID=UPI001E32862D|nr:hypothetical protein [Sphingomonas sp. Leaf205]
MAHAILGHPLAPIVSKPNRTTFIALVVLDEAIQRLRYGGPLKPPEHGVRLALAYLYSITLTKNRDSFDELWRTLMGRGQANKESFRSTWAGTQFAGICREVGVAQDIDLGAALAHATSDHASRR